jgi:hypothetical protein
MAFAEANGSIPPQRRVGSLPRPSGQVCQPADKPIGPGLQRADSESHQQSQLNGKGLTMSSATHARTTDHGLRAFIARGVAGAAAGIAGGLIFGILMVMTGMLPMVAMLVGSSSAAVGAIVHLIISAGLGALFAFLWRHQRPGSLLIAGAAYGVIWWVLGALLLMPLRLGMPEFEINTTTLLSLMGHLLFGLVTAGTLWAVRRKTQPAN